MTCTSAQRRGLVAAVLTIAVVITSCGTPPPPPPTTQEPAPTQPTAAPAPTPTPTPTTVASPAPVETRPTPRTAPSITPVGPWVGHFAGRKVQIPYGNGAPVSFTFDDGPSPVFTPQVLALLKKNHTPAVFCLIGTQARYYPVLVRKEVGAGHVLCNHSHDHDLTMNSKGKAYVQAEVDRGLTDIKAAAPGVPVPFYRQPGGFWSPAVVQAMNRADLIPLRWSDDPRDWSRPGSDAIVHRVVKGLRPGAVILMHDGGGDRSQTVEALAWLLPSLAAAGWKPVLAPQVHLSPTAAAQPQ